MKFDDRIRHLWIADYVIARVRSGIGATYERYTKYSVAGAWAGAALVTPQSVVEIYFDSKDPVSQASDWEFYFSSAGIRVGVFGDPALVRQTAAHVPSALGEALRLSAVVDSEPVRIASIHASLLVDVPLAGQDHAELFQEVCNVLGARLDLPWVGSPGAVSGFGDKRAEGDITFVLPSLMPEEDVVRLIQKVFPDVRTPLLGWGALPIETVDHRISWVHLYLRQVYELEQPGSGTTSPVDLVGCST